MAAEHQRRIEIFGHRGASALRPEHTLAAYAQAIADGADFIEPDLVVSKDGVLIIRHEPNIADTTDVARHAEFASRRTEKVVDGHKQVGWFAEDFTLAELKTLRAIERLPQLRPGNTAMDGQFELVTWQEMIDFAAAQALARGRMVGLVPELKHSTYFRSIGLPLEDRLLATLGRAYAQRCPLVIQCFEVANLKYLRAKLGRRDNLRLMQLIGSAGQPADHARQGTGPNYAQMLELPGLREIAAYADILAPDSRSIIPLGPDRKLLPPTDLVADAHAVGLQVMPYTFRPENYFLAADFQDAQGPAARNAPGSVAEMRTYIAAGIDGLFTDDPALGRQAAKREDSRADDAL
jgi:glycerophosphoryl diester phosphodiesterase